MFIYIDTHDSISELPSLLQFIINIYLHGSISNRMQSVQMLHQIKRIQDLLYLTDDLKLLLDCAMQ